MKVIISVPMSVGTQKLIDLTLIASLFKGKNQVLIIGKNSIIEKKSYDSVMVVVVENQTTKTEEGVITHSIEEIVDGYSTIRNITDSLDLVENVARELGYPQSFVGEIKNLPVFDQEWLNEARNWGWEDTLTNLLTDVSFTMIDEAPKNFMNFFLESKMLPKKINRVANSAIGVITTELSVPSIWAVQKFSNKNNLVILAKTGVTEEFTAMIPGNIEFKNKLAEITGLKTVVVDGLTVLTGDVTGEIIDHVAEAIRALDNTGVSCTDVKTPERILSLFTVAKVTA
jgi:hypothetical protein